MKHLGLVLALCGATGLALAPISASAFEIQGEGEKIPGSAAEFHGLSPAAVLPQFDGYSLAMPYNSTSDKPGHVSDYGNDIVIPAPGVDRPVPAWSSGPFR
jgi:hypothetical protein